MNRLLKKIISAGEDRRTTRFHTGEDQLAPLAHWPNIFRSSWSFLYKTATGRWPELPWIPYAATKLLAERLRPDAKVLEIGGGGSTVWLARHAGHVTTFEANENWVKQVGVMLKERNLTNVDLRFEWERDRMCNFSEWPDGSLDLVFVDGGPRQLCVEAGLRKIKPGGWLYLDNSDLPETVEDSKRVLIDHAHAQGGELLFPRDFIPCSPYVGEGALYGRPR